MRKKKKTEKSRLIENLETLLNLFGNSLILKDASQKMTLDTF